jgi:hypothetical protein
VEHEAARRFITVRLARPRSPRFVEHAVVCDLIPDRPTSISAMCPARSNALAVAKRSGSRSIATVEISDDARSARTRSQLLGPCVQP